MKKIINLSIVLLFLLSNCNKKNNEKEQTNKLPKYGKHFQSFKKIGSKKGNRTKAHALHLKAFSEYNKKNINKAISIWIEAAKSDPSWYVPFFNLACMYSLLKKKEDTLGFLLLTLERKSTSKLINKIKNDSDLKFIRTFSEFNKILQKYKMKKSVSFLGYYNIKNKNKTILPANHSWACDSCSMKLSANGKIEIDPPMIRGTYKINKNFLVWHLTSMKSIGAPIININKSGTSNLKFINDKILCLTKVTGNHNRLSNVCYNKEN